MPDFTTDALTDSDPPVLVVHGDLDGDAGPALHDAYATAAAEGPDALVLDFNDLGFMNSSGIAHVVSLLSEAREDEIDVRACGLEEHYEQVFRITRLADHITVCDSREDALAMSAATPTPTQETSS